MRQVNFVKEEKEILKFWGHNKVFEKTLQATKKGRPFVFFEGPPTANGRPGIHHVLSRSFKDVILRYQTMLGRYVLRRAGWDTHGLPVEIEVEKKLGLKNKKDIEKYGIAKFNQECKKSVWQYKDEWEKLTHHMGFWLDLKHPYITYEPEYIESLWAIIKKIWQKKLLVKDYKVVPLCVRCGTALSSHEVAQGYETVKDVSVYVKFKVKKGNKHVKPGDYILAWTTTPWTLPGNLALAVGPRVIYQKVLVGNESFILARDLVPKVLAEGAYKIMADLTVKDIVGVEYEPLFKIKELESKKSHRVYPANFVSTDEGTGVVHTAVMYGVDDFALGTKVGLPKFHTVDEQGKFVEQVPVVGGASVVRNGQKDLKTEKAIIFYLKKNNFLFKEKVYEHEYPFCWRCQTPLLYYAKDSWFVKVTALRQKLITNNKKVNWIPDHIKEGRFGEWLREVKDWAFSRERYWGTPLPVWECQKCHHRLAVGSLSELNKYRRLKPTKLILMRHGQAISNVKGVCSAWPDKFLNPLTPQGQKQALATAKKLKKNKIDVVYSSDLLRAKETAAIVAQALGIRKVIWDERLREINVGSFNGQTVEQYHSFFKTFKDRFINPPPQGESWLDVSGRVRNVVEEINKKQAGRNVLVISHMDPLFLMSMADKVFGDDEIELAYKTALKNLDNALSYAHFQKITLPNWPYDDKGMLDLHRPYIDSILLKCNHCSGSMKRVTALVDAWFDSGAMPWAQWHWPFAFTQNKKLKVKSQKLPSDLFPADYITEGVDQTRGWFYTLLAVATLLGRGAPYKNVISLNHVLDEKGQKMSKSRGNVVDPWPVAGKLGWDVLRWYFYSVNSPGDNKLFNLKDVESKQRRFFATVINSFLFLETYFEPNLNSKQSKTELDILDKWILSRLGNTEALVTRTMASYNVTLAARTLEDFVEDLSNWYIRRSRRRFQKPQTQEEKAAAQQALTLVLGRVTVLLAPFTPFLAEWLWQNLKKLNQKQFKSISVHLERWPLRSLPPDQRLEKTMRKARSIVALGLAERAVAGIKVRQPLKLLALNPREYSLIDNLHEIVAEELNVEKIVADSSVASSTIKLDIEITAQLKTEGLVRDLIRQINEMRRAARLEPGQAIWVYYDIHTGRGFKELLLSHEKTIKKETYASQIHFGLDEPKNMLLVRDWKQDGVAVTVTIKKA